MRDAHKYIHVGLWRNIPVAQALKTRYPLHPLKDRTSSLVIRTIYALYLCLLIISCAGPGYYYQAASGQWQLMHTRQDINELLEDAETDPGLATRLQTAIDILGFAENQLALPAGGSFKSFVETGRDAVVWNVVATPEFSLKAKTWCFPVAGCVPYRGYFKRDKAEKFASKYRLKGFDVMVSPATAYSTLGWFEDPLLDTMLRGSDPLLAATLIHELAHQRLYVSGDTSFNEAYAGFVEISGVKAWLNRTSGVESEQDWLSRRAARQDFHRLLASTRDKLTALYLQELSDQEMRHSKVKVFDELRGEYVRVKGLKWQDRDYYGNWMSSDINNAHLVLFQSYEGGMCAFAGLFNQAGEDIHEFHQLAKMRAEMVHDKRQEWLAESCSIVASRDDL